MDEKEYSIKEQVIELSLIAEIKRIFSKIASRISDIAKAHKGEKDFSWDKYPNLKKQALEEMEKARGECIAAVGKAALVASQLAAEMNKEVYGLEDDGDYYDYNEEIYDKTFKERLGRYSNSFLIGMALVIAAGVNSTFAYLPGGSPKILSLGRKLPSIGRGDAGSPVLNVIRLAEDVIRRTYHQTYFKGWKKAGFRGYMVHRGSDYNCPICNTLPGKVYPMTVMIIPIHLRCLCYTTAVVQ